MLTGLLLHFPELLGVLVSTWLLHVLPTPLLIVEISLPIKKNDIFLPDKSALAAAELSTIP